MFIESICTDEAVLEENYRSGSHNSPCRVACGACVYMDGRVLLLVWSQHVLGGPMLCRSKMRFSPDYKGMDEEEVGSGSSGLGGKGSHCKAA